MKTSDHRTTSYANKVGATGTEERYTAIIAAQQDNMQGGYQSFAEAFCPFLVQVKTVLDNASVLRLLRGAYFAFAGEVWHVNQTIGGAAALIEITAISAKWVSRGLVAGTLLTIVQILYPEAV